MRKIVVFFNKLKFKKIESLVYINEPNNVIQTSELKYDLKIFSHTDKTGYMQIDKRNYFKAYAVFDKEKLVHLSFVFKNNLLAKQLGFNDAITVGDCITNIDYRGKGIYPTILKHIRTDFFNQRIIVFVEPNNVSSIKGIERAGFNRLYNFKMYRCLGINLYTKKNIAV